MHSVSTVDGVLTQNIVLGIGYLSCFFLSLKSTIENLAKYLCSVYKDAEYGSKLYLFNENKHATKPNLILILTFVLLSKLSFLM